MPEILLIRLIKNIVVSISMILAGIVFGISTQSIYITSIPFLLGLAACAGVIKLYCDWENDKILVITAVCIHKEIYLGSKSTYVMTGIGIHADKVFNFTLKNIENKAFSVSGTYDLLFKSDGKRLSEENLIDYCPSDSSSEAINSIIKEKIRTDESEK